MTDETALDRFDSNLMAVEARLRTEKSSNRDHLIEGVLTDALQSTSQRRLMDLLPSGFKTKSSAFFTPKCLAQFAIEPVRELICDAPIIIDPMCGAGDLLLAVAACLPETLSFHETKNSWTSRISGGDIHQSFVHATSLRLRLLALLQHGPCVDSSSLSETWMFPSLQVADAFDSELSLNIMQAGSVAVINPPFHRIAAPSNYRWGTGSISFAAAYLDFLINHCNSGVHIVAILPDVLRTGSSYSRWRAGIHDRATVHSLDIWGRFDVTADIDVFVLRLTVQASPILTQLPWWSAANLDDTRVLDDVCSVRVGTVVPHRDLEIGTEARYIYSRLLSGCSIFSSDDAPVRRHSGARFNPPFIALRRTSSPNDPNRPVATIITGSQPVAVENHLIVITPRDGSIHTCHNMMNTLRDSRTREWLDNRIRTRHLTTSSVKSIPLGSSHVEQ